MKRLKSRRSGSGVAGAEGHRIGGQAKTVAREAGGRFCIKLPARGVAPWYSMALVGLLVLWLHLIPPHLYASPRGQEHLAARPAVLPYIRTFSTPRLLPQAPVAGSGVITGTVVNGTTGQPVPDLPVLLGIMDGSTVVEERSATTDAEGVYRFEGLSTEPGLVYVARAEYPAGIPYSSAVASFSADQPTLHLPIEVFDTTTDGSAIWAERVHFIVEFAAGRALIAEMVVFSLGGNRTYIGDGTGVLRFTLPAGAQEVVISDDEGSGRYRHTNGGFVDTWPLPPGQFVRQILFRYALPYSGDTLQLDRTLAYPIRNINVLISDPGGGSAQGPTLKVTSGQLMDEGVRQTPSGRFISLVGQNLPANHSIQISIANLSALTARGVVSAPMGLERASLAIAVSAVALIAVVVAARPLWRRRVSSASQVASHARDSLIDALARLENAYEAGEVSEAAYRDQRRRLKAQLLDVLREEARR
jgi:hypothetical protein